MRKTLITVAAMALAAFLLIGANTARNVAGWQVVARSPADAEALLAPYWRLVAPEGPGPFPAAILLSGCDGIHDNMDFWADRMVASGRAALIVDSHGPRNLVKAQAWRAVCAGQILTGAERAGDVAVALAALRRMPRIDAADVALIGASHGGWTAMELLARLGQPTPPPGLTAWPDAPATLLGQIGPVVLLYPYCGFASGGGTAWPDPIHALMILAENDSIVSTPACRAMGQALADAGTDIRVVVLPGVNHGFDQSERSILSRLKFDGQATEAAAVLVDGFLNASASGGERL